MFGDLALKLVQEARAGEINDTLHPYNDELVRLVLLETRQLQKQIDTILEQIGGPDAVDEDSPASAQLVTHNAGALRNKRCLLAYHNTRMQYLRAILWSKGGSLDLTLNHVIEVPPRLAASIASVEGANASHTNGAGGGNAPRNATLRSRLSATELVYVREYADLIRAYKGDYLDVVDVGGLLQRSARQDDVGPIRELMVSIVVNVDARDVQTERGSLTLRRGERLRLLRSDVEALIVRGWVTVVDE